MSVFVREMPCQELVQLVTAYFDGSLSRSDRRRFRAHIRGCENCTAYVEQMRLMIEATGRLTEDDLDPAARDELLEAFRGWRESRSITFSRFTVCGRRTPSAAIRIRAIASKRLTRSPLGSIGRRIAGR